MNISSMRRKLNKAYGGAVTASLEDGCVYLRGELQSWDEVVRACQMCARAHSRRHVVNDIKCPQKDAPMRLPGFSDDSLGGEKPDVLIIGGGISGATIARELSRYELDILLVDKENDLAVQSSGRNDGEIHPGIDLRRGSLKHSYVRRGNAMYPQLCRELDVPFKRVGQYVCFRQGILLPAVFFYALARRFIDGIGDTRIIFRKKLLELEPGLNSEFKFAMKNPSSGCVSPYELTIACAENAVMNGARVSLDTAVTGMDVRDGEILAVHTNRGTVYPRLVINAAGVFSEEVARMAGDRFFSIHPRRGTNSILDKKAGVKFSSIASVKLAHTGNGHTKGGGILNTVHGNLLVGPDAVETWEKENYATSPDSIERVFSKQKITMPELNKSDIITYFTGVRAATFEEDFIIEPGRKTKNLIHCAGIQSPGLTTAPAVAQDVAKMAVDYLSGIKIIEKRAGFNPTRKAPPRLRDMDIKERGELIRQNPDYGEIVCRCEEISRGEILDALRSPIPVPTLDGVKRRVRPGMGRCQGGFCAPTVVEIIAEEFKLPAEDVTKSGGSTAINLCRTK